MLYEYINIYPAPHLSVTTDYFKETKNEKNTHSTQNFLLTRVNPFYDALQKYFYLLMGFFFFYILSCDNDEKMK